MLGMVIHTCLAAVKLAAGLAGHSYALVAAAVESGSDLFSSIAVWRGMVVAAVPADGDHPYGHGKAEPIAASMVATMLLLAALGISFQAVREILHPHMAPEPYTLYVLVGVVVMKETLFRVVFREGVRLESSAVRTDAWHHRSDALTSLAAGVGISVALIGGEGYEAADDYAALAAASLIAWNGGRLLRAALDELMDAAPPQEIVEGIRAGAGEIAGVARVEKCLVRKTGYHYFVEMHVEVDPQMSVQTAHGIAHAVKDQVRARWPRVLDVLGHVEPAPRGAGS
jgi:cation diffusion facilitator family transporter